jgi:hypothetical protein
MDSRTAFALVLAIVGLTLAWAAVTGRAKQWIQAVQDAAKAQGAAASSEAVKPAAPAATPSTSSTSGGGSATTKISDLGGAIVTMPNDVLNGLRFNVLVGTDGIKATPYAGTIS